jgi:hypothetical protein
MFTNEVHMIDKCVLSYFSYIISLDVRLLQIKIYWYKTNCIYRYPAQSVRMFYCTALNIYHIGRF